MFRRPTWRDHILFVFLSFRDICDGLQNAGMAIFVFSVKLAERGKKAIAIQFVKTQIRNVEKHLVYHEGRAGRYGLIDGLIFWLVRYKYAWLYERTRPIRPTMRPHDDEMIVWWRDYVRFFLTFSFFDLLKYIHGSVRDRSMDWQTDVL